MKPETLGEVHIMFQNLLQEVQGLAKHIEENTKLTEQVLAQATKTNGRVNVIEPLALDYQEQRARFKGATWVITLVGMSILGVGGFALNSYLDYKTGQIVGMVEKHLETKYDIEYEQAKTKAK